MNRGRGRQRGRGGQAGRGINTSAREYGGVGFIVSPKYWKRVVDYEQINGRLATLRIKARGFDITLLNTYCHPSTRDYDIKSQHFMQLSDTYQYHSKDTIVYVVGDMNARLEGNLSMNRRF